MVETNCNKSTPTAKKQGKTANVTYCKKLKETVYKQIPTLMKLATIFAIDPNNHKTTISSSFSSVNHYILLPCKTENPLLEKLLKLCSK